KIQNPKSQGGENDMAPADEPLYDEPSDAGEIVVDAHALGGRYILEGPLSRGALATTYRAIDQDSGRTVAVKLFDEQAGEQHQFRERLLRLASQLATLDHPNIAAVLDAGVQDGRPYLVTELVEGDLAEGKSVRTLLIEQGHLPVERAVTIGAQVAEGLAHAHQRGIIHGDLRPENVVVGANGQVKLLDFSLTHLAVTCGLLSLEALAERAAYLSPEQVMGAAPTVRSDTYSLAVMLYEALAGAPPFAGANLLAIASQRLVREPASLRRVRPDVPLELDNVILRALAPNPIERHGSAIEFRAALLERELALQSPALHDLEVARDGRPVRPRRSRLEHIALLAPALATAAVGTLAFLFYMLVLPQVLSLFQFAQVPDLGGHSLADAAQLARAAGLDVSIDSLQPSEDKPKDTVIGQLPPAGSRASRTAPVKLVVSAGIQTPDLRGMNLNEARALLVRRGWKPGAIETQLVQGAAPGTVVGQKPGAGELVPEKGELSLSVAGGNYAEGAQISASAGKNPGLAVDGKEDTFWTASGPAPQWIEIDMKIPVTLGGLELVAAQQQSGPTIHEVWVTTKDGEYFAIDTLRGITRDRDKLVVRLNEPVPNVVRVKIHTALSAGDVGWREIRIVSG
ncbi:MAG: protein kinase, partial [Chloroflexi bacterium]|nr:protein kinase [Chloroflexota bacterium]